MNNVQFGWFKEICSVANVNVNCSKLLVSPISCHRRFSDVFSGYIERDRWNEIGYRLNRTYLKDLLKKTVS